MSADTLWIAQALMAAALLVSALLSAYTAGIRYAVPQAGSRRSMIFIAVLQASLGLLLALYI